MHGSNKIHPSFEAPSVMQFVTEWLQKKALFFIAD